MKIKIKRVDNTIERQILTGMIVSTPFLREIQEIWEDDLIRIPFVRIVGNWCLKYLERYNEAPITNIQKIYETEVYSKEISEDQQELLEKFLAGLSVEFERKEKFNYKYVLQNAVKRFKQQKIINHSEEIKNLAVSGEVAEAEKEIENFHCVEIIEEKGINPFTDKDKIKEAFSERKIPLLHFKGELGKFLNYEMIRDAFISFQGPEKRGKTWWLLEIAMRAAFARCNVVFISAGDMSINQLIRRKHIWLAKKSDKIKYCGKIKIPTRLVACEDTEQDIGGSYKGFKMLYKTIHIKNPLTAKEAIYNGELFARRLKGRDIKLFSFPTNSISVKDINNLIYKLEHKENFIPDVIIIDYADILAPIESRKEYRHQINDTWGGLRRLSQEKHCLVVTATQSNKGAYTQSTQNMDNVSEDKRKLAHVNGMIGLNQTGLDKEIGIMRLNWIVLREDEFFSDREVYVTQCLKIGRPHIRSFLLNKNK